MVEILILSYFSLQAIHFAIIPQNYSLIFGFYTEIHQKEDNLFASVVNSLLAEVLLIFCFCFLFCVCLLFIVY